MDINPKSDMKIEAIFTGKNGGPGNVGGHMKIGVVIFIDGVPEIEHSEYVPEANSNTENSAGYLGLIFVLKSLLEMNMDGQLNAAQIEIKSNNQLVIMQMKGAWRISGGHYLSFANEAKALLDELNKICSENGNTILFEWHKYHLNGKANQLCNNAQAGVKVVESPKIKAKMDKTKEYILCAAIHYKDGRVYKGQPLNIESGFVISAYRHGDCAELLEAIYPLYNPDLAGRSAQGFLTSKNRYVGRAEAFEIALKQNQLLLAPSEEKILTSEDLYFVDENAVLDSAPF